MKKALFVFSTALLCLMLSGSTSPRILSPYLTWNTFLGSSVQGFDNGGPVAADQKGNIFFAGLSGAAWGTPINPFGAISPYPDVYVAKLNGAGSLQWHTFLGINGEAQTHGRQEYFFHDAGLTLDRYGNIYVVCSSSYGEVYAAKLNSSGARQWLVALGSPSDDGGLAIAVDASGNVFVGGWSAYPWGTPVHPFNSYGVDAFLAKLNPNGVLLWNTFWGGIDHSGGYGGGADHILGLATDAAGNVYATGRSGNTWGTTVPIRPYSKYDYDAFVAKFDASGILLWYTFLGAANVPDSGNAIAVDSEGSAYVAGTGCGTWGVPVSPFSGNSDIFAAKLNTSGIIQWSAFLGSTAIDEGYALVLDSNRNIYIAGTSTASWGSPERPYGGGLWDAFALKLDANGNRLWNTFLGGTDRDDGMGIGLDHIGNVLVSGYSTATWGSPILPYLGSGIKGFVAKIDVTDGKAVLSTSKSDLYYGAVAGGAKSAAQKFQISNIGAGLMDWTLTSNRTWLSCAPASGYGNGIITVSVNPAGLPAGTADTGAIQITSLLAYNSPRTVNVHLNVLGGGATAAPFGSFDSPLNGTQNVTGAIPVTGWALDDIGVSQVRIWRDPVAGETPGNLIFIGDAVLVEGARPDVEAAQPNYPQNAKAGWGYMLLTNMLPGLGNGIFKLYAYATDYEGNTVLLGIKIVACSNAAAVKPFGTIDTPAQGGEVSGSSYVNFGWVLTPLPKTVAKDGSKIDVYVDGVKAGNLAAAPNVYDQYRVDVSTLFAGLNNSSGPVGAFYLDTTGYENGVHTIYWVAEDNAGSSDGIGSRYFNISNTGTAPSASHREDGRWPDAAISTIDSLSSIPLSFSSLSVKRGFDRASPPEVITPDHYGIYHIDIKEVELLKISLNPEGIEINNPPSPPFRKGGENRINPPSDPFGKGGEESRVISTRSPLENEEKGTAAEEARYTGFMTVNEKLRVLPIGSTLDPRTGTFSWLPGPGFLGNYDLVFVDRALGRTLKVKVTISPKYPAVGNPDNR